jgi:hypothetical protein
LLKIATWIGVQVVVAAAAAGAAAGCSAAAASGEDALVFEVNEKVPIIIKAPKTNENTPKTKSLTKLFLIIIFLL